jgi:hypothetical protein
MHVEQRHVTTVNLQDGQARDFVVFRDPRGCKVSCVTRDEVLNLLLSYQDFQRLCQTLAQPNGHDAGHDHRGSAGAVPPAAPPAAHGAGVRVERRQVTTVSLHPSQVRHFTLTKDERGYRLGSASEDEVVTVLLSPYDFQKLRQQVARWEWRDVRRDHATAITAAQPAPVAAETCEVAVPVAPAVAAPAAYPWGAIDWLGFN